MSRLRVHRDWNQTGDEMEKLLLAAVAVLALAGPAHSTNLNGEALALTCEGNLPNAKTDE